MLTPANPENEKARLDTLRGLNVLDTPPEERFDRLTRLAKRLFGVPIALVSLVDDDRQWFKSCMGLDAQETPRDISFCGHAILQDGILIVPNALSEERFCDNPLVTGEPHIRFYAGCPLQVGDGFRIGTLCLIDQQPREFTEDDYDLLRDLAKMAEQELAAVQLASMDELTSLSNRRGFQALGQHAFSVCRRMDKPMSVMFIDLDDFKQINDRFGHAEGDLALTQFARILREHCRESDVMGRLGGDEYAVLMTGADPTAAEQAVDRLRTAVDAFCIGEARGYNIGFSAGLKAVDFSRHTGIDDVLAEADGLMYEVKKTRHASKPQQGRASR